MQPRLNCPHCDSTPIAFLNYCTPEEVSKIAESKTCHNFKRGEALFYEDSIPQGIFYITYGIIKLTRSNKEGKEQIIRFAKDGEFLGYRALLADEDLTATATCIEDTHACFIPKKIFMEVMLGNPQINKLMFKELCHDLGITVERVQSMAQKSVRERLAETILYLQETFAYKNNENETLIPITLPREDIANIVGTATETVIRLLSEFRQDKLIEMEGKKIRVLNRAALEKISHASV